MCSSFTLCYSLTFSKSCFQLTKPWLQARFINEAYFIVVYLNAVFELRGGWGGPGPPISIKGPPIRPKKLTLGGSPGFSLKLKQKQYLTQPYLFFIEVLRCRSHKKLLQIRCASENTLKCATRCFLKEFTDRGRDVAV